MSSLQHYKIPCGHNWISALQTCWRWRCDKCPWYSDLKGVKLRHEKSYGRKALCYVSPRRPPPSQSWSGCDSNFLYLKRKLSSANWCWLIEIAPLFCFDHINVHDLDVFRGNKSCSNYSALLNQEIVSGDCLLSGQHLDVHCSVVNSRISMVTSIFSPFFFIFKMTSGLTGSLTSALPPWPITSRSSLRSS